MKQLDVEQSVNALFGLCTDVSRVNVRGESFFYLEPKNRDNLKVMTYILRKNGVKCHKHWSRYYTVYGPKSLVLRVRVYDVLYAKNPDFGSVFTKLYEDRHEVLNKATVQDSLRFFKLFSASKKVNLINQIVDKVK